MYRILVVDDELHIVEWISDLLKAEYDDVEIHTAYSGVEALKTTAALTFDLVLLDIVMPQLNGIETAKRLLERQPNCKIILLTGISDFEFIYQVNEHKNIKYLLKTETDRTILDTVQKSLKEIAAEEKKKSLLDEAEKKQVLLRHFEQRGMLYDIIYGANNTTQTKEKLSLYRSSLHLSLTRPLSLAFISFHRADKGEALTGTEKLTLLYPLIEKGIGHSFHTSLVDLSDSTVLCLMQEQEESAKEDTAQFLNTEYDRALSGFQIKTRVPSVFVVLRDAVPWTALDSTTDELVRYMKTSLREVKPNPVYGVVQSLAVLRKDVLQLSQPLYGELGTYESYLRELSLHLYQGEEREFQKVWVKMRELISEIQSLSMLQQTEMQYKLLLLFIGYINQNTLQGRLGSEISQQPLYRGGSLQEWSGMLEYLEALAKQLFEISLRDVIDGSTLVVQNIKTYVQEHIGEDLSLTKLSQVLNYNQSYLSRLFKQMTGENLSQYIRQARIDYAKTLLETTGKPVQEIATLAGFETAQYFSMVFRKEIGATPKNYRIAALGGVQ